ncbi:DUF6684 family protein [Halobaculum saliterrae]|uniref:DUF6684 family protein n=1 Tax=Halobaculum saliterrae TaxID=2073113 RepID=UPI001F3B6647|nr:DUF6684 family protein [Halobaculum saliterrae]
MAEIFDRDTLLDLTVNVIPLGIILFFVAAFVLIDPFGGLDFYGRVLQMGLLAFPLVALAILTYVSGKAIAGDEKRSKVFFQGQATIEGSPEKHEVEEAIEAEAAGETDVEDPYGGDADEDESEVDPDADDNDDNDDESDVDADDESDESDESDADEDGEVDADEK